MRTHDRPVNTHDEHVTDLTVERCNEQIELLVEKVVGCHCTCPQDLLTLARWKQRRLDLLIPRPR